MQLKTNQQIIAEAKEGLLTQNAQSVLPKYYGCVSANYCAYRGGDGMKCAVGFLIPDSVYDPAMEGNTAEDLLRDFPEEMKNCGLDRRRHGSLLSELQSIHDNYLPPVWPSLFAHLEEKYDETI